MEIISNISSMIEYSMKKRSSGRRIGFVPTMGYLHEGHLSLVRIAAKLSDIVVVSIFVNPMQFAIGEDLEKYPRNMEMDDQLCRKEGVDVIFSPSAADMYYADNSVVIEENDLSLGLCGASRPGHFRGVLTVVAKLFNIVMPNTVVLGQKDAQQASVIQKMVRDLNFPVEIVVAPIVREYDGLAMSSRNVYLSSEERKQALCLYESLCLAENMFKLGVMDVGLIRSKMEAVIKEKGGLIDYIFMGDSVNLKPVDKLVDGTLVAVAVRIGKTRLIDNIIIESIE